MFRFFAQNKQLITSMMFSRAAPTMASLILTNGFNHKALEIARNIYYHSQIRKTSKQLRKKYPEKIIDHLEADSCKSWPSHTEGGNLQNVWVYWDSGFQFAPDIVKLCISRIIKFRSVNLILVDDSNYREYIQFPNHIEDKYSRGLISKAHFSDLLRIELLYQHGGIWLDSTVFLSGETFPAELLGDDLFFYGMGKPASNGNPIFISSWAISSPAKNMILAITRSYLNAYWKKNNSLKDYFLMHIVICSALETFPEYTPKFMGFYSNSTTHLLLLRLHESYRADVYENIMSLSSIHKLTYKYDKIYQDSNLSHLLNSL